MLSGLSQTEKDKYHAIPLIYGTYKNSYRQIADLWLLEAEGGGS